MSCITRVNLLSFQYLISVVGVLLLTLNQCTTEKFETISNEERLKLRDETRDMFYHAYWAYMENAFPADELMPLSCKGRYRGSSPSRGDIDECLGNFSLTLIDTLDSLVILSDLEEFEHAVKLVINHVSFDNDVVVSVFETNIRVLGGLLSAHILANYLQERDGIMPWYKDELLDMAKDVGYRLLPAFNTTTGIPYARVNMKYGIKSDRLELSRETCTACAGSMILEMAALSRLTGEFIFEEKAHKAMDELWKMRHRSSDLMGTVLNVHSGDWIRKDSGVGAGIDSYYEYCLKAYILLGDNKYLNRFNRHYNAIMKYVSQGPLLVDVHMHRPHTNSRNYMDALLAFWPGLQVLKGDIKHAVETHEMLYQVMQRHTFIPEAFTTDFQVHWGNHPLRPEFLESTYFLYAATNDPYYLTVGKNVLKSLQKYARVPCGYAAVNDVRTRKQEDRMDSFVLSETFKYLYLLFADKEDLILNLDEFIFTTEGHLLPLTLAAATTTHNFTKFNTTSNFDSDNNNNESSMDEFGEFSRMCPNTLQLFPETVRKPLQNMVDGVCPKRINKRRLTALEFSSSNLDHLKIIKEMGISIMGLNDGRVQLVHTFSSAKTITDAEEGLLFMQEMIELSKLQSTSGEISLQAVTFPLKDDVTGNEKYITLKAGSSQFGKNLKNNENIYGQVIIMKPFRACTDIELNRNLIKNRIAIMERGDCMFVDKVRRVQNHGALGAIIIDNTLDTSSTTSTLFSMFGDGNDDVKIPTVFLFSKDAAKLLFTITKNPDIKITLHEYKDNIILDDIDINTSINNNNNKENDDSMFYKLKVSVQEFLNKHAGINIGTTTTTTSTSTKTDLSKTLIVGNFIANVGTDKIRISFNQETKTYNEIQLNDDDNILITNPQWVQVRKGLLTSILNSPKEELIIPINILKIYYQSLSEEDIGKERKNIIDTIKQTEWLLNQLTLEYQVQNNAIIKFDPSSQVLTIITNFNIQSRMKKKTDELIKKNTNKKTKKTDDNNKKLDETLTTVFERMSELKKNALEQHEMLSSVLKKMYNDELIVSEIVKTDNDKKKKKDDIIKTKRNRAPDDEL